MKATMIAAMTKPPETQAITMKGLYSRSGLKSMRAVIDAERAGA
jgi:hypothetical protein